MGPRTVVAEVVVPAAPPTVAGAVRSVAVLRRFPGVTVPDREHLLCTGDVVRVGRAALRVEHEHTSADGFALRCGPDLQAAGRPCAEGTVLTLRLRVRGLDQWARAVADEALRLRDARAVVAGAVVRGGRLLLARRASPPELAGRWELPGGGVEPGEDPAAALVRELAEELGVRVEVGERLGADVPIGDGRVLRASVVRLVAGEPRGLEHQALAWVDAAGVRAADLVPADVAWRDELVGLLAD